jgi:alpha-amylase
MARVVAYFQVHQPFRLRKYSVFDVDGRYFDEAANQAICQRVAHRCYRPALRLLRDLLGRHDHFRLALSVSGAALEQFQAWCPDVIDLLRTLAQSGRCEFLGETFYHSLASQRSPEEFDLQVAEHTKAVESLLGQRPRVFRNTELIYDNALAQHLAAHHNPDGSPRWSGILTDGVERILQGRPVGRVYHPPAGGPGLLLKHARLSDDIAFRFSDRAWAHHPLTPETFAAWIARAAPRTELCNLFMDFETFGEHQPQDSGIFDFLRELPDRVLATGSTFATPGEALAAQPNSRDLYDVPQTISWADSERDLSAWQGNAMQQAALDAIYALEVPIKAAADTDTDADRASPSRRKRESLLEDWRRLTTSDHFYYMSTKGWSDGQVHAYFSPYPSPYEAFIHFMNVVDHLRARLAELRPRGGIAPATMPASPTRPTLLAT